MGVVVKSFNVDIGCLYAGVVRQFLRKSKFQGLDIDFFEEKENCWLLPKHTFYIKGNPEHVTKIYESLKKWLEENQ